MEPTGLYHRPATRTAEAPLSAPLLNQPPLDPADLAVLREQGLQGALMVGIVAKIKAYKETGRIF